MSWFKNLKKWQKGGLIGCAVGLLLAGIVLLSPHQDSLGEWIYNFHGVFFSLIWIWGLGQSESSLAAAIVEYGGSAAIVVFYGLLGMLAGRVQQIDDPIRKWVLTGLLALFLLLVYFWVPITW
jgi:hypothetical protein